MQGEVATVDGEQDAFDDQVDQHTFEIVPRPVARLELVGYLADPPRAWSVLTDDPKRREGDCRRWRQEARREVEVNGRTLHAGAKDLVHPSVAETSQL